MGRQVDASEVREKKVKKKMLHSLSSLFFLASHSSPLSLSRVFSIVSLSFFLPSSGEKKPPLSSSERPTPLLLCKSSGAHRRRRASALARAGTARQAAQEAGLIEAEKEAEKEEEEEEEEEKEGEQFASCK